MRTGSDFNHRNMYNQYGALSRIDWWWDAGALKGMQVWYGGTDSGLVGMRLGSGSSITLRSGEVINWMGWSGGDYVGKFSINTNLMEQQMHSSRGHGPPYNSYGSLSCSTPSADSDGRLAHFGGVCGDKNETISQLKVVWRLGDGYGEFYPIEHSSIALQDN